MTKSALGDNYRPCNTFIQDVLDASIIAIVLHNFSLHTQDDMPVSMPTFFLSNDKKQDWFDEQILNIVGTYILNESPEFHNMLQGNLQSPPQSTAVPRGGLAIGSTGRIPAGLAANLACCPTFFLFFFIIIIIIYY